MFSLLILAANISLIFPGHTKAQDGLTEFPAFDAPSRITTGPDGKLWFNTTDDSNTIGSMTLDGTITHYSLPSENNHPVGVSSGPDGNIWFAETTGAKISRVTPQGSITEFPLQSFGSYPTGITSGSDGNLWFTERFGDKIGKITPNGTITEFSIAPGFQGPYFITTGADGNLWFTEFDSNRIGRITTEGNVTEFPIPTNNSQPIDITTGNDGNIWFTESNGNKIGRITPSGIINEFSIPTGNSFPNGITSGSDGNIWFTESWGHKLGKITQNGILTEFSILASDSYPSGITTGPDGNIWFTEPSIAKIGRINPFTIANPVSTPTPTPTPGTTLNVPLLKQGVLPYTDTTPPWEGDEFDHANFYGGFLCGTTIAECGCAMTSTAMIFQYYGIQNLPDGTLLTPGTFNTWLKNNNGYFRDEGLNPYIAATLAKKAKAKNPAFTYDALEYSRANGTDRNQLTQDLQNQMPDVLEEPGHFIVATGISDNTFTINDPFYNRIDLTSYNDSFLSLGRYARSNSDSSYIVLAVDKEIDISLKDSAGNSVGTSYLQYHINNATTTSNPTPSSPSLKILAYPKPANDSYSVTINTSASQKYQLDTYLINQEGDSKLTTFNGQTVPGINNNFSLSFDKSATDSGTITPDITLTTIRSDLENLYASGLIDNMGIFVSLKMKIDLEIKASLFNTGPKSKTTGDLLKTFLAELNAQRGKHISEDAYQILSLEAKFLINN